MDNKKKKLPNILKLTIVLAIISIFLLIISIVTSTLNVKRTEEAINNIGNVSFDLSSEEKIDLASNYYSKLDTNINLEKNVSNKDELDLAIYNYVRLGLKKAIVSYNRRIADNIDEETIKLYVNEAYLKLKKYYKEEAYQTIEGYSEYKALLDIYKEEEKENNNNTNTTPAPAEEPEIC